MNQILVRSPELDTNSVQYSTASGTSTANYFSSITPKIDSTIEIVKNQIVLLDVILSEPY